MRQPSSDDFAALLAELEAIADLPEGEGLKRHQAVRSLRAVLHYFGPDPGLTALLRPLHDLHAGLIDDAGRAAMGPAGGRPDRYDYQVRGALAAVLDMLITGGMRRKAAIEWLKKELPRAGIDVTAQQIARWRDDASSSSGGPDPSRVVLAKLRERRAAAPAELAATTKARARLWLQYLAVQNLGNPHLYREKQSG